MKLPAELLEQQFRTKLIRGAIIKFEFDAFADPKRRRQVRSSLSC
jgi:hypothetical protein